MIQAELKGKDSSKSLVRDLEDFLTSNVFGILKNIDPVYLTVLLEAVLSIKISGSRFEFSFWPSNYLNENPLLSCEPDCIVENEKAVRNQLLREHHLLNKIKEKRNAYLIAITDDYFEPKDQINNQFNGSVPNDFIWFSWQTISSILEDNKDKSQCKFSRMWIDDLLLLLKKKGLYEFRGFNDMNLKEVDKIERWIK